MKKLLYLLFLSLFAFTACEKEEEIIDFTADKKAPKVEVCHYDATTDRWETIEINENAVKAHLNHGDFLGDCDRETYVPDDHFEYFLMYEGYDDSMDNSVLTKNITNIKILDIPYDNPGACGGPCSEISDITGIEDFISLTDLSFGMVINTNFDFSFAPNLEKLRMREQEYLTYLDLSHNFSLSHLYISGAKNLTTLDLINNTALLELNLEISPLIVNITSLDLSNNTEIVKLILQSIPLSTLDLSNNTALTHLEIIPSPTMISLNLNNQNNQNLSYFYVSESPNLTCFQVDDVVWSIANWTNYYTYSKNCY